MDYHHFAKCSERNEGAGKAPRNLPGHPTEYQMKPELFCPVQIAGRPNIGSFGRLGLTALTCSALAAFAAPASRITEIGATLEQAAQRCASEEIRVGSAELLRYLDGLHVEYE
jgi:hypothetical protein